LVDAVSKEDVAQFVSGEKELTLAELCECSPLGKEGILFVSLILKMMTEGMLSVKPPPVVVSDFFIYNGDRDQKNIQKRS
jgi:succinate-acetate transporter protein